MKIIQGTNDFVEITLSGVDLTTFDRVQATLGTDTRDSVSNPGSVVIVDASTLRLFFGDTVETGSHYWQIIGFNVAAPLGVTLTSKCVGNLEPTAIC